MFIRTYYVFWGVKKC